MENADGSERRDWEEIVALKAKWIILMALNTELKRNDGSERQMENVDGSECQD